MATTKKIAAAVKKAAKPRKTKPKTEIVEVPVDDDGNLNLDERTDTERVADEEAHAARKQLALPNVHGLDVTIPDNVPPVLDPHDPDPAASKHAQTPLYL